MVKVKDMMEIAGADLFDKALSFVVVGDPPVQKRHRIAWRHMLACAWKKRSCCRNPIIYNPSAREKVAFRLVVRAAMEEIAIATFPYIREHHMPSVRTAEPPVLLPGTTQRKLPDYIPSGRC
jgi:hypothetical protein